MAGGASGDPIFATPGGWLGLDQRFGWKGSLLEPERVIVLEDWGAFDLQPIDAQTTRLIVRTRGSGHSSWADVPMAPFGLIVFEPAHFIIERKMLLEIKERAETV